MREMRYRKCQAVESGCFLISGLACKTAMHNATIEKFLANWAESHAYDSIN